MRSVVTGIPVVLDTAPIRKRSADVVLMDVKMSPLSSYCVDNMMKSLFLKEKIDFA
jgi:hypothetical protein